MNKSPEEKGGRTRRMRGMRIEGVGGARGLSAPTEEPIFYRSSYLSPGQVLLRITAFRGSRPSASNGPTTDSGLGSWRGSGNAVGISLGRIRQTPRLAVRHDFRALVPRHQSGNSVPNSRNSGADQFFEFFRPQLSSFTHFGVNIG